MKIHEVAHQQSSAEWSNRILILSLLGITYLTLFPFRFDFSPTLIFHRSPFLLGMTGKRSTHLDFFLNVLLFVPFGFGLSAMLRKRGNNRWTSFLLALAVGAGVSYLVELLQFYIPVRDSGWQDVISNTTGSIAGFFVFELCGGLALKELSFWENAFESWLSPHRAAFLLVIYFTVSFGISALLQNETRLRDWDPQSALIVGNDATGKNPWKGKILLLQIWDRALPDQAVRQIAAGEFPENTGAGLLALYDFTNSAPYQDRKNFLPSLGWTPEQPQFTNTREAEVGASSWLRTPLPAENLTREIQKSSQFTVHIVCVPAATQNAHGRIVSLSQSAENANFYFRQEGANLVFWFRNPLSVVRSSLSWTARGAFEAGKTRDIVASYDGSDAFLYLDGNPLPRTYRLSPGASLMHLRFSIETGELSGYVVVYETLIFLPAGMLIGVAARSKAEEKNFGRWILVLGWAIPPALLEFLLAGVSGRRIWPENIALSLAFGLAGMLLINADRLFKNSRVSQKSVAKQAS